MQDRQRLKQIISSQEFWQDQQVKFAPYWTDIKNTFNGILNQKRVNSSYSLLRCTIGKSYSSVVFIVFKEVVSLA